MSTNFSQAKTIENIITQTWHPLKVYACYRLVLALILLTAYFFPYSASLLGRHDHALYFVSSLCYAIITIVSLYFINRASKITSITTFAVIFIDIVLITVMAHASGGVNSNLVILLVVAVAAGGILIIGQVGTLIAAIATIAVIYEQIYFSYFIETIPSTQFIQAGLLGITFFGTSLVCQLLSKRLQASELLATQHASDLRTLEKLNHHIIQRMRTGIIAIDDKHQIRMLNESAWHLLNMPPQTTNQTLEKISPELNDATITWLTDTEQQNSSFRSSPTGPEISASFTELEEESGTGILIFLDDNARMTQQAQQLKLASLGRLTAGIAHEIRNPLGAISHAAQLLQESTAMDSADLRLTQIIQNHSVRMNDIIENVLQLSRQKPALPTLLNIGKWLPKFMDDFQVSLPEKADIHCKIDPEDLQVRIDPSQLSQIITNLSENGLRYSKQATNKMQLELICGWTEDGQHPYVDIIDKGLGVDKDQVENLFEPFFTSETTGTGLGLYIAKELCESNQARLNYIPVPTGGSCFRITFAHPGRIIAI
ncbi:MAG: PAS domain-containing sensor histidine kinase [Pseudomonadales bacterium]|nr:PAS domain-containing sensor histidine kinase [Pseudomonadales bacterium]